jgi:hypothetical protein
MLHLESPMDPATAPPSIMDETRRPPVSSRLFLFATWLAVALILIFYVGRVGKIGIDLRNDFWDYWQNNRFYGDVNSALRHGQHVLGEAEDLAQKDPPNPGGLTIEQPGPGLFDAPRSPSIILHRWHDLRPVYGQIYRGWVATYDNLVRDVSSDDYQMDYPPLRSLVMTLWAWKVKAEYPSINQFPQGREPLLNPYTQHRQFAAPEIVHPLLMCNMFFEGVSSIAIFLLVFIWVRRDDRNSVASLSWRSRWGDPMLLTPSILLGIFTLLAPHIRFDSALPNPSTSPIDQRVIVVSWWIFLVLRFLSVVSLARFLPPPFRAIACALVAGTLAWINPASILDSFGWPQWEAWLLPFLLIAAVLVSLDWWLTAGLVLGVGCMFKGQLLFLCPVLVLAPLFAGWPIRFLRIVTGLTAGAGIVCSPWLANRPHIWAYICCALFAAAVVCLISLFRYSIWNELSRFTPRELRNRRLSRTLIPPITPQQPDWFLWILLSLCLFTAIYLPLLLYRHQDPSLHILTILLTLAILVIPWFLARRTFAAWLLLIFSASLWLAAFSLNGSFSWWQVGFVYGTQKHQDMQLGAQSLSNLSSLLSQRYGWNLHDAVGTLHLPFVATPIDLDLQTAMAVIFALTLLLATYAAAVHLRRRDKKFLVAFVAPCILFVSLLTQMAARYTMFSAVVAALFVAVSVGMSLLQLLLVVLSCVMLGNQLLGSFPDTAPITYAITRPTYPDSGWMTLLLAAVILFSALIPSRPPNVNRKQLSC